MCIRDSVYLEMSWAKPPELKWLVDDLGIDRIMMGGDLNSNLAVEVFKFRALGLSEDDLAMGLGGTAIRVFNLPVN